MRITAVLILILLVATAAFAQRPRTVDTSATAESSTAAIAPAPQTVKAKYEGGVFGYNKTMDGTLSFDDTNNRLLFRNKQQKEVLFIPYDAVTSAFADTQKRRPAAATVASHIPYIGLPLGLIKTKVQYLTLQFNDPDSNASGITSFKLENKQILASVLKALAQKARMTVRGEVYVRNPDAVVDKTMP